MLVALRMHALPLPLETDECNYAYIGERLLNGEKLYADVWDHQPPAVYVLFAGVIALFGSSDVVFRMLATAFSLGSLALIYGILAKRISRWPAFVGALAFALTSSDPGMAGEGCNREIYMNTLTLAAFALLLTASRPGETPASSAPSNRRLLVSGALIGLASLFKTVAAAQWFFLAIWLFGVSLRHWGGVRSAATRIVWFAMGPALVWSVTALYFAWTGRWSAFMEAVFGYNLSYSGLNEGVWGRAMGFFTPRFPVFAATAPIWFGGLLGGVWLALRWVWRRHDLRWTRRCHNDGALLCYLLGSFLAVCLPGLYWHHYYYLLLPPLVLVCGTAFGRLLEWRIGGVSRWGIQLAAAGWIIWLASLQFHYYLGVTPEHIAYRRYDYRDQWAKAQGLRIASLTEPDDQIFVWGKDAGVYFYSRRRCASRYTMVGALESNAEGADARRAILLDELRRNRPRVVLVVEPEFDALRRFLQENYVVAGVDMHDRNQDEPIMLALQDPTRPVRQVSWEWRAPALPSQVHD